MDNWQIPITENGTTTLATAGKYCDRNIDVNVEVEGSVEAALETVTLNIVNNWMGFSVVYYTADQTLADVEVISSVQIEVAKNSFLVFYGPYLALNVESGCIYECAGCYVAANSGTVTNDYAD